MNYKLVCIDVDGTLYGSNGKVSKENKIEIQKAYKKGVQVVICTGRIYVNALQISKDLGILCPVIGSNGAICKDDRKNKTIFKKTFSKEEEYEILSLLEKYNVVAHLYTENKIIANSIFGKLFALLYKCKNLHKGLNIKVDSCSSKKSFKKRLVNNGQVMKCVIYSLDNEAIRNLRKDIEKCDKLTAVGAGSNSLEITPKNISKGVAVKELANFLNISSNEVICIGDNENDIEMIKYAGLGVAMGNAIEDLKKVSDYVTDSNDENGVAKVIAKFI